MEIANDSVLWRRADELFGRPREQWTTVDEMIYELPDYFNNDIEKMVEDTLGVPSKYYVDVYGMSEMNGLGVSCEGG